MVLLYKPGHYPVAYFLRADVTPGVLDGPQRTTRHRDLGEIAHKAPWDTWDGALAPGIDAAHRDYASFAEFADPDGNTWVLQERGYTRT